LVIPLIDRSGDRDLLAALASGEESAAVAFVHRFGGRVFGLAPSITPPAGFAERVVTAGAAAPSPPPAPRPPRLWLVAAALLLGAVLDSAATLGILAVNRAPEPAPTAVGAPASPLLTADGGRVGSAGVADLGRGGMLVLSVTAARPGATYGCVLIGADGSRTSGGTWTVSGPAYGEDAAATWFVPVDGRTVSAVELVTPSGRVWATARL